MIAIDLARVGAAQELYDRMTAEGIVVDVVINNAGIFSFCDILDTPAERIERIILLHDLTVTQLCRLFAADMVRRGVPGAHPQHVVLLAVDAVPGAGAIQRLESLHALVLRGFRQGGARTGIRVTAVCPAGVATDLYG